MLCLVRMWKYVARLPFVWRSIVKALAFVFILGLVLYPNPVNLVRQISHLRHSDALIQPDLPFIAEINQQIDATLPEGASRSQELKAVERYVYKAIPYAFDWEVWDNVDYWPTAAEVWEKRREDCDGRAVLSASILRARGYKDAKLVGNLNHVWVAAGGKELMGAEKDKNFTRENGRMVITPPKADTVLRGLSQVWHFPFWRLAVLVTATVFLCVHPRWNARAFAVSTGTGMMGLASLYGWARYYDKGEGSVVLLAVCGALLGLALVTALLHGFLPLRRREQPIEAPAPELVEA